MTNKPKLIDHRKFLSDNNRAYSHEIEDENIERLVKSLVPHLKNAGLKVTPSKNFKELPLCWNSPKDWDKNFIKYEWGHLRFRNQAEDDAHKLENLGLYSARCNQHIQTSLHIEELMVYGGILAQRIRNVLAARRKLFESKEWKDIVNKII